jgi:hypothetical protein
MPTPLYRGTTFASRHDYGDNCSTALSFMNVAMHSTPAGPRCFSICSGMQLNPELLLALKLFFITAVSSAGVMCYVCGLASGANSSAGMDSL